MDAQITCLQKRTTKDEFIKMSIVILLHLIVRYRCIKSLIDIKLFVTVFQKGLALLFQFACHILFRHGQLLLRNGHIDKIGSP